MHNFSGVPSWSPFRCNNCSPIFRFTTDLSICSGEKHGFIRRVTHGLDSTRCHQMIVDAQFAQQQISKPIGNLEAGTSNSSNNTQHLKQKRSSYKPTTKRTTADVEHAIAASKLWLWQSSVMH